MQDRPVLEFWYDFASTYSYLAAMRIEALAAAAGVALEWRPFLLGPIFAGQGWSTSPFHLYPAKGRHMWRDMEREADALGLPLVRPEPFPQNSLLAARVALAGVEEGWCPAFTKALYEAEFADGRSIADPEVVADVLAGLGRDPAPVMTEALSDASKARLRTRTEEAVRCGIFGAPSFVAPDGELFWGNDRLEQAVRWAGRPRSGAGGAARPGT